MAFKKIALVAWGVTALALATNGFAMLSVPYGWYLEANIGASKLYDRTYPANSSVNQSGIGGSLNLGYKFMPFFAAELGYSRYTNNTIKNLAGTTAANDTHYAWDIAAKGIVPFSDSGFEGFGKLGVQRIYSRISLENSTAAALIPITSSSNSATGFYLGAGGQYYFMPEFAVVGQWARASGSSGTGTEDLLSIGVSFIFD